MANATASQRHSVTASRRQMKLCSCVAVSLRLTAKRFYKGKRQNQNAKKALGKQEVSLGESRSFVRGKSEFPLGKVQEAKRAEKREDLWLKDYYEVTLHFVL